MSSTHPHRRRRAAVIGALLGALLLPAVAAAPASAANTSFFIDCSASSTGSGSQTSPWNSLAPVNQSTFGPGDQILFKAGTTCIGQVAAKGSGVSGNPIRMSSYGSGAKPIIDAAGATGAVILLRNVQQWEVSNLELRNAATAPAYRAGLLADNASGGVLRHIVVTGMTIRNISGYSGGWYATNAGVGIQTSHTSTISTYDDIVVADNTFDRVDRIAVAVTPDRDGEGTGLTTNVKIQRNFIRYSGGDDILVVKGDGALIEGNDAAFGGTKSINACPPGGQYCNGASASIWMAGSNGTLVQGNSSVCNVNEADGQGYDVDWGNTNTTIQYNYSRNNRGGFILIMPPFNIPGEPTASIASSNTVVRYNVSEDDADTTGCPVQPRYNGPRDVIHFAGGIPNNGNSSNPLPDIVNNTIFIPQNRATYVIGSRQGVNASGSFEFRNNIVANYGTGGYVNTSGSSYSGNLLAGNRHPTEPTAGTIFADPQFAGPVPSGASSISGAQPYRLAASSPALRAGQSTSAAGSRDFAGTSLPSAAPTIGAFEATLPNPIVNGGFDSATLTPWALSGNGTAATVTTSAAVTGTHGLQTGPSNSGGQQVVSGLTAGATYRLTASLRVQNAGEEIALGVKDFGGAEAFSRSSRTVAAPVNQYFTLGGSSTQATVYCYKNAGVGAGYCDAFSLVQVPAPADRITNGGFETGSLGNWVASGDNAATVSAGGARSGAFGLVTAPSSSGAQQTITGLSAATTYTLTGWARASIGESVAVGVKDFGGSEFFRAVDGAGYSPVSLTFTTGSAATSATVYCYKNAGSIAAACDDLRLTRLR
ncbi:carbohydrate-binding protein [Clavibacter michiganensis]|nr:carbohydrate-binding protein [Clavibacter michiganensis]